MIHGTASGLADALRDRYVIERELGRGGMATVYLARDLKHDRLVALKVLRPELAVALGAERFLREIRVTAKLQHPHLLTVLDSGECANLVWYTMPFVEGETLRARLLRENELPLDGALGIVRDVAAALAYAHRHGIMHRDVKPENILLEDGEALLADFGIARAVAEAAGGDESLTGTGLALGTAAYMSPEQAAGERGVDGRADIYALGCVLYEMLAGEPPYTGHSAQAIIAKRFADPVPSVQRIRPQIPASVDAAIQQALARSPADRFATPEEFSRALEVSGRSVGSVPAARVALLFGAASAIVLAIVYLLVQRLGLPAWVLHTAVVLLVAGFPILLITGLHERRRDAARSTGLSPASSGGIARWFTWRRAIIGGALAFSVLAVLTGAYMAMRLLGIGPVGTLVASGVLKDREPILLADFENRSADSMLGSSITEAFRVDLSQSPTVRLVEASIIRDALSRMKRQEGSGFPAVLARDVAEREGIKAIVTGRVDPVGTAYVLTAQVVSTSEGRVLAAVRQTAEGDDQLVRAIDHLSKQLRERIGESLVSIRKNPPLERVTTASLPALRKYSTALRLEEDDRPEEAIRLLQEAVALDSGFAMAWRKLAVVLGNFGIAPTQWVDAATRAFSHRDRLPELEANLTTGYYYQFVGYSPSKAIAAYRSALEVDRDNLTALNNLAVAMLHQRQWSEAESLAVRASHQGRSVSFFYNAVQAQVAQGHFDDARKTLARYAERSPGSPSLQALRAEFAIAQGDYETAAEQFGQLLATHRTALWQMNATSRLALLSRLRGKVKEAEQYSRSLMRQRESNNLLGQYIEAAVNVAMLDLDLRGQLEPAKATVASALARHPLEQLAALDRPYVWLIAFYAKAGNPDKAHRLLREYEAVTPEGMRRSDGFRHFAAASLAESEGRARDAAVNFRAWFDEDAFGCGICGLYDLARLAEKSGQPDSAITLYVQSVSAPSLRRLDNDAFNRAPALKRLGELYEAKGDRVKAADYYGRFLDLWKEADPELQPIVREVRERLAKLVGESGT